MSTSGAFVIGSQYGPWVEFYQSSLDLVHHDVSMGMLSICQKRPTKFSDHVGYTSWCLFSLPVILMYKLCCSSSYLFQEWFTSEPGSQTVDAYSSVGQTKVQQVLHKSPWCSCTGYVEGTQPLPAIMFQSESLRFFFKCPK